MINKIQIKTNLTPDKSLYEKLGHGQHELHDAIAELIDNSFDARTKEQQEGKKLITVTIRVPVNVKIEGSLYADFIEIEDDASGMNEEESKNCLVIAKTSREGKKQGRYGLGIKQSCLSIGKKFRVITKKIGSNKRYIINFDNEEFINNGKWEDFFIECEEDNTSWHGTIIKIWDFWDKKLIYYNKVDNLKKRFEWIFGPFIKSKQLTLTVNNSLVKGRDLIESEILNKKDINLQLDVASLNGNKVIVTGWVGFRKEGGSTLGFSGFNLFRNERLVKSWEHVGYRYHAEYRNLIGELHLNDFPVTLDKKDFMRDSPHWKELAGEPEYNPDTGAFEEYDTKNSKLYPILKNLLREYKREVKKERVIKKIEKEKKELEKKKIFFEGFGEKRKELKKVKEIATTIQKLSGENEISETEKDLIETAKKLEEEQEEFVETLIPKSFLETKKITIDNKEYSFDQLTKGLDMNKPYSLEIKSDEIMIIINTNYPFFEELKKDFSLYTKMITLTALAEAIEKIKKKPTGFILNRLFEQYGNQLNQIEELKNEDIEEIDNNLFKIVF